MLTMKDINSFSKKCQDLQKWFVKGFLTERELKRLIDKELERKEKHANK